MDLCAICGQPLTVGGYFMTDKVTGEREIVCSNCAFTLPRCYLCGLPIKQGEEMLLPDGRYLCAMTTPALSCWMPGRSA